MRPVRREKCKLPLDRVIVGECIAELKRLPEASVDLVFADPPYNLQLDGDLLRPNNTVVDGVHQSWDKFASFADYDAFSRAWLGECRRVLKPDGAIWVIGSYHNIFRLGTALQDLGYWIQNDVIWLKTNPMPNFRGKRFTNAHETLIWAGREQKGRVTFNYEAMKAFNDDVQMRSDWLIPICSGPERLQGRRRPQGAPDAEAGGAAPSRAARDNQSRRRGARSVLRHRHDGCGRTRARPPLHRHRARPATMHARREERIAGITPLADRTLETARSKRAEPRVPFGTIIELGMLRPGAPLVRRASPLQGRGSGRRHAGCRRSCRDRSIGSAPTCKARRRATAGRSGTSRTRGGWRRSMSCGRKPSCAWASLRRRVCTLRNKAPGHPDKTAVLAGAAAPGGCANASSVR